ncbi:WD-40 repeat-containing [Pyrrhoderma noxium]|uniref:WD-40 repeat-containing n=1 Tax=Pyrrhoderma noxium TaxID=2282107 RepID=A0A286U8U9_9AGAM|nr:WD-40 repeat-containing [Pyrrhoderma noxium]
MVGRQIGLGLVVSAIFSPDGRSIVLGDYHGRIRIWNVDTGVQDGEALEGHASFVTCLSFSSDGRYLVSGEDDMTIMVWDMARKEVRTGPLRRHTERVTAVSFSPNGNNVVSGSWDRTILLWSALTGEVLREIECENKVYSITYSPNRLFILGGGKGWMSMWNVSNVVTPPKVFHVDESVSRTSFSPNGNRFMSGSCWHERPSIPSVKGTIQIWDASWNMEEIETTFEEQEEIDSISLSPGGKFIASGSGVGHSIYLWNVLTGELVKKLQLSSGVESLSFSPINEQHIAFGSWDGKVQLWDVTNDEPITIGRHTYNVFSAVFSPSDGEHIASCSGDKTICIWNVEHRELAVGPLTGHTDHVLALVYSPDGTWLVSGSANETFRIWDSLTGQLLSTLNEYYGWVKSVAYSSDGSRIVSGSWDITI